ncbi:4-hydroxy-tetrahydrodipicolinate synthase [Carnobacterium pleistocenium]|uniref:4-hydroxy-tetrahydrodipicolinate synthase n=1 Tax=Carnobacterium pleistocenium TaxID=181073 RepID=UPI000552635D|nr:4-hydroxy-tetrahydrodipicolinate synthase [Carnobacterium pleistocenium]
MDLKKARIITAMTTPFNEQGSVDYVKLEKLINFLLENGTEGLVVGGTTGESPTLAHAEKVDLYRKTVELTAGRVPIIAGTGSFNTAETIAFTKEVEAISGIDAALVVVPYYSKPNQAGLYAHFEAVATSTTLPIIIYNVPGRTSVSIDPKTTIKLSAIKNIIGVKECLGLDAVSEEIKETSDDFLVYTGEDGNAFPAKCIGATGVISVASHVLGNDISKMYDLLEDGSLAEAAQIHRELVPKMDSLFTVPSPAPVKFALNQLGIDVGGLRLPLVACTEEEEEYILKELNWIK